MTHDAGDGHDLQSALRRENRNNLPRGNAGFLET